MNTILIIEDEESVRELLRIYLEKEGFAVEMAADGEEGLAKIRRTSPDLIILDIMLPQKDGFEVCREVRQKSATPIIMLTARGEELDRVLGLELGADDYIPKPFSPREVVARVKAVLRRTSFSPPETRKVIKGTNFQINYPARKVEINQEEINLTPKEFELLWFLVNHPYQVFTRDQLLEQIWEYDFGGDTRTVDTHIKRLREKLSRSSLSSEIKTVWGYGYKFDPNQP
ncbi:MAG: two-component system, OmpR family, response regulator ResD [Candidatus Atribacteria bacterium]|nr:two-component system, OmpR family, response regulator ResD [Candidatus Atribacteria bacterium]